MYLIKKKKINLITKISILLIATFICSYCASKYESSLHKYISGNQKNEIINWKRNWEYDWDNNWKFDSANISDIDHSIRGCKLYWTNKKNELEIKRIDAFNLNGKIYWSHEKRILNDTLQCRGEVLIFDSGEINYKRLAYLSRTRFRLNAFGKTVPKILYYEIEIFDKGKHLSTYRSRHNQLHLNKNKDEFELKNLPKDLKLVFGKDILKRKRTE